jgi:hypothetical protein
MMAPHSVVSTRLILLGALSNLASSYTWPDEKIDLLEGFFYEQDGNFSSPVGSMASGVFPCGHFLVPFTQTGRSDSAEWLRTAYHDMATADVDQGTGGIDASIAFETTRPENIGAAFNESLSFFADFHTPRSSMSDLIAMGAILAVEACSNGAVSIPYKVGRVDVTEAGPPGVPRPEQNLTEHILSFKKQGFTSKEMIGLVACGHTIGGVHGDNFPDIVPPPKVVDMVLNMITVPDTMIQILMSGI